MKLTNKQRELIKSAIQRLSWAIDEKTTQRYVANLVREETKAEREHRNGWCCGRDYPRDFGPKIAAELITAQHILGFVFEDIKLPTIESLLYLRETYVKAAAIAATYSDVIKEQVNPEEAREIRALDYAKLASGEQ